jgi:hypothetical protein
MLRSNKVSSIRISAFVHEGNKSYTAQVTLDSGTKKNLAVADPDSFAFNLEATLEKLGDRFDHNKLSIE